MAVKILQSPPKKLEKIEVLPLERIAPYMRERLERDIERLRALSEMTDFIEPELNPLAGALSTLIDLVADDLEKVSQGLGMFRQRR